MRARLAKLALLLFALGASPASAQFCVTSAEPDGLGGTGAPVPRAVEPDGIGGTGLWASSGGDEDGLGGTGIEGAITGFGSVCVNALRVAYDDASLATGEAGPISAAQLRRGDVVRIAAERRGDALYARTIERRLALAGPVAQLDAQGGIVVLGQRVRLADGVPIGSPPGAEAGPLAVGDFVRVAGFRRADGEIVASRIERAAPASGLLLSGRVEVGADGGLAIGALAVAAEPGAADLLPGRVAVLRGRIENGRLIAEQVQTDPELPFGGELPSLSLEGFPRAAGGTQLELDGVELDLSVLPEAGGAEAADLHGTTRARVGGRLEPGGVLRVERLEIRVERADTELWRGLERGGAWREYRDRDDLAESLLQDPEPTEPRAQADRTDRPERERVERPERDRIERPERVERPEPPERPERPEREDD